MVCDGSSNSKFKRKNSGEKKKEENDTNGLKTFLPSAFWRILSPMTEHVEEPSNPTFKTPYAPTINKENT